MATITLTGTITKDHRLEVQLPDGLANGRLEVQLPDGLAPGDVQVSVDLPYTQQELDEALTFQPATGAEIVASGVVGAWSDLGITDSAAWVDALRRREENRE
jgi:hypothetical protein